MSAEQPEATAVEWSALQMVSQAAMEPSPVEVTAAAVAFPASQPNNPLVPIEGGVAEVASNPLNAGASMSAAIIPVSHHNERGDMTEAEVDAAAAAEGLKLARAETTGGYKGVKRDRHCASRPFNAQIKKNGHCKSLGYFATAKEAGSRTRVRSAPRRPATSSGSPRLGRGGGDSRARRARRTV